jgi:hypothetical protein
MTATLSFERRRLGRSELTIPRIALGCGNFGGVGFADERVTQIVVGPGRRERLAPVAEAIERPLSTDERDTLGSVSG